MIPYAKTEVKKIRSNMPDLEDFLTVQQAAILMGYHVNHVRRMRRQGDLEGIKIGATWLISKASVRIYLEKTSGLKKFDPRRGNELLSD